MIDSTIKFLSDEINLYLSRKTGSSVVKVVPGGLADDTGKWAVAEGTIGLSLVNVEEERMLRSQVPEYIYRNGSHIVRPPQVKLNLLLVFATRNKIYTQALSYLGYVITYFQAHPVFAPDEYPGLDDNIEKLSMELITYGPEQLNQLWAYIGAKYLPSVVYRVRVAARRDDEALDIRQPIVALESIVLHK